MNSKPLFDILHQINTLINNLLNDTLKKEAYNIIGLLRLTKYE